MQNAEIIFVLNTSEERMIHVAVM